MAWTYNGTPLILGTAATLQNQVDTVRFLLGDTDSTDPQLQDGEVQGLLQGTAPSKTLTNPAVLDPFQAAIAGCVALAGKYSRRATKTTGDFSIQAGEIAQHYMALRNEIRKQARRYTVPIPYSGGLSKGDMQGDKDNDDVPSPFFQRGMTDNPTTSPEINTGGGFTQVVPG